MFITSNYFLYDTHHTILAHRFLSWAAWSGCTSNEGHCNLKACPSYEPLHLKCALTVTPPITLWQSDWHFQAWHSILMLAIKVCSHFQHQIWITSHYRLVSKVQTWPYWPDQTSFLPPWMFWKLLYGKCTLNHLNAGKFQPLSRQTDIHKFTAPWQCISLCVFTLAPLPSIHFSPSMTRGGRGNGRDHYITKHPQATVLSNCHTRLPIHSLQASGQVLCGTLQTQEGWEEKIELQTERNHRKDGKEEREWDRREGGIETKHHVAGLSSPSGSKSQLLLLDTLDICVYDPDNVCLNMERLQKVKGQASMVDAALVSATSKLFSYPTGTWHLSPPGNEQQTGLINNIIVATWPHCCSEEIRPVLMF